MCRPFLVCCALCAATASPAPGNYADETGFNQLKAELGAAMPTGAGVGMSQVEAGNVEDSYMPHAGSGTFAGTGLWAGKTFTARNGATGVSDHAIHVGLQLYGTNTDPDVHRASMAPGVADVDGYNANNWDDFFLAPGGAAPIVEIREVQNHGWIHEASTGTATTVRDLLRRQDFSIDRDNYVCCVGLSNDVQAAIPDLFAAGYNIISVGLTSGEHSRGTTTSDMDGPGRRKPEIVAPLDFTSFSTAYTSSAAALLREKANLINTANARRNKTIKAILLAGATKDEFPGWAKTGTHPLDDVYGAGELNIYHSYHIMDGGEQPANNLAGRPFMAWDHHSLSANGTADYRLRIPAGVYGVELSAFIVWHRTLTDAAGGTFSLTPDALVNFDLALLRDPVAGGAAETIDSSTSTLYNLEHVWKRDLPAGNYRLRVSRGGGAGTAHDFAIAWRLTAAPHEPQPGMQSSGGAMTFTFPGLLPGQSYIFQSSPDLVTWTDIESFTATVSSATRVQPAPAADRRYYRLLPVLR
jgi:hypothetical protein